MHHTRRRFLGATAAVGVGAALAGCLGGNEGSEETEPSEPPVAGDPDAELTVTVYEDFNCPSCGQFKASIFPQLESEYIEPELIRYEHRDFPLPVDETWSWAVPNAAREVYETEGDEAFWSFSSAIYEHLGSYSYDVIESVADEEGLDGAAIRDAAEGSAHQSTLEADRALGEQNGVSGTPTIFVDGEVVELEVLAFEQVAGPIEAALE